MADAVEGADAVRGDAEHLAHGGGGDQTDPEPGERAGAEPGDDRAEVARPGAGLGEHRLDLRGEQFTVGPGVDRTPVRPHRDAVRRDLDQGRGDRGGRGVHHQYEHGKPA